MRWRQITQCHIIEEQANLGHPIDYLFGITIFSYFFFSYQVF